MRPAVISDLMALVIGPVYIVRILLYLIADVEKCHFYISLREKIEQLLSEIIGAVVKGERDLLMGRIRLLHGDNALVNGSVLPYRGDRAGSDADCHDLAVLAYISHVLVA